MKYRIPVKGYVFVDADNGDDAENTFRNMMDNLDKLVPDYEISLDYTEAEVVK